ncbi:MULTISPECIES: long-chain fatty acid--CoA ligase [Kitasatospora]|uniref:Putative long-chain fatty-acid--CoA ligase n=1 Tax=Kitasatospora setae (strain ATCC 33774 / DSM 43861 / JCM 3304 / KCC A-0304 / NBRC 14216 / KM-6054) TaxID=452652 RepID=E4N9W1_KITSK|nr:MULTISPECIES: long-chain fatty acid--CoA ligase [Kitasatospora]BAJ27992.1 putative long-chain fatty-acid--CoA ligase [Kitasatospora setae KM-6054]
MLDEFSLPARYQVPSDGNLADLVHQNAERHPGVAVLSRKSAGQWQDLTAAQFLAEVHAVAKGLVASGVGPGDRVAVMSRTRYEWTLLDFAIWTAGAITVPVYETSSAEQVRWILGDSGALAVVTETDAHAAVVEEVRAGLPGLEHAWQIERGGVAALTLAGAGVDDAVIAERRRLAGPDAIATIVYTSGTTGRPKGCQLTHGNFLAELGNVTARMPELFRTGESSVLLFLPLAHVLGRIAEIATAIAPVRLGHVSDIKNVTEELGSFKPTLILGVPRVFEKVYNTARAKAQADGKGKIFDRAADTAVAYSRALDAGGPSLGLRIRHAVFDKLVYGKLRGALGGRCRYAISGGAPLGERLGHFYRGIGFVVLEGYGLTESCAATAFNPHDRPKIGTVGQPLPGSAVRIAEDGEVLLKGPQIFTGYWNNPAATAEALRDGWFATGDLGTLDGDGYLTITGRKKEIIVTAGGKNVAPAVIEDRIRSHAIIGEVMVVGDRKPFIACLVTVDDEFLPRWKALNGKPADATLEQLRDDPDLLAAVQAAIDDGNQAVSHAEAVKKFHLLTTTFTEAGGHLTPSLKLKRNVVLKDFAAEIEGLYTK